MGQLRIGITAHRGLPDLTTKLVTAALHDALDDLANGDIVGVSLLADGPDSVDRPPADTGGSTTHRRSDSF
jgi:hypothetical protein